MNKKCLLLGIWVIIIVSAFSGCTEEEQTANGDENGQTDLDTIELSSSAFENGDTIPIKYSCDGEDIIPPLTFGDSPENTTSFAIILDDPDAPGGTFVHWLVWNIPSTVTGFSEGEDITYPQGINDFEEQEYGGPCPPVGSTHRYYFRFYALDTMLDLDAGATRSQLENAMEGHVLAEGQLMVTYSS